MRSYCAGVDFSIFCPFLQELMSNYRRVERTAGFLNVVSSEAAILWRPFLWRCANQRRQPMKLP
jgi:hypothetical protein